MPAPWTAKGSKGPPLVIMDEFLILDSQDPALATKNKRVRLDTVQANLVTNVAGNNHNITGLNLLSVTIPVDSIVDGLTVSNVDGSFAFGNGTTNMNEFLARLNVTTAGNTGSYTTNVTTPVANDAGTTPLTILNLAQTGPIGAIATRPLWEIQNNGASQVVVAANGTWDFQANSLTDLSDPTNAQDAATKNYVDGLTLGLSWNQPVRVASTANISLSGVNPGLVDDVALVDGNRILLKEQSAPIENGIYLTVTATDTATWIRTVDMITTSNAQGAAMFVIEGTANGSATFVQTLTPAIVDTNTLSFETITVAGTGLTQAGNSIALDTPVTVGRGGTGSMSFTTGGLLLGGATLSDTGVLPAGNILIGSGSGAPTSLNVGTDETAITMLGTVTAGTWTGTTIAVANGGTGVTMSTGTGSVVLNNTPTFITPALGTPTGNASNLTNIPMGNASGTLAVANGGTGVTMSTGSDSVVLSNTPTLTTPTIASFTNATHDHSNNAGGGTFASTNLSDTANIAYLNTANVFQDFTQTFTDNSITIQSPNGLTPTTLVNSQQTVARTLTIPILGGNRDIVVTGNSSQITIGTEVTGASTALSDSSALARIATANSWGAVNQNISSGGTWQEGGANISPIGLQEISFDALDLLATTTAGAVSGTAELTLKQIDHFVFVDGSTTNVTLKVKLPNNFNNGTIQVRLYWYVNAATAGDVQWEVKGVALGNGNLFSTAFGTPIPYTDSGVSTTDAIVVGGLSGAVTIGNTPADNDSIYINIARLGGDVLDTLTDSVRLISGKIQYTTDAATAT